MTTKIDGSFINFRLVTELQDAILAGIIKGDYIDTDKEQCHISELERILTAFDEEEVYVATKTFIKHHRKAFVKILEYMEKEGEKNERNKHL